MIKEIKMPAGGQTTDVSVVGTWLVKCGDKVKRGDALLEIETDKATLTVESFAKGTVLALLAKEGDRIPAGEVIALIGEEGDRAEAVAGKRKTDENVIDEEEYQPIDKNAAKISKNNTEIKAMPNAKLLAKEKRVALTDVAQAVGKSILKRQDVEGYLQTSEPEEVMAEKGPEKDRDVIVPFTNMRKVIARRMSESAHNIPVFTASVEINMTQCIAFRKLVNSAEGAGKVSYNDILFKCIEAAIRSFPYVNASCTESEIILHKDVNIGLAVSVENGLVVPVVRRVQEKNISEISACNKENVRKARALKILPEDMSGGTITLSNLGMYPVTQFTAIINPPEVCILAAGAITEMAAVVDGELKILPVMKVTGSFDHRVIDGAYGAGFLAELKNIIENPALALV